MIFSNALVQSRKKICNSLVENEFEFGNIQLDDATGEESEENPELIELTLCDCESDLVFYEEDEEAANAKPKRAGRGFGVRSDKVGFKS